MAAAKATLALKYKAESDDKRSRINIGAYRNGVANEKPRKTKAGEKAYQRKRLWRHRNKRHQWRHRKRGMAAGNSGIGNGGSGGIVISIISAI